MKTSHKTLIALLTLAGASAFAQTPGTNTPRVDQREANQQARIDNAEAKAKSDGTVTAKERRRLHAMQDGASRDIHRKKHNARAASAPG